MYLFGAFLKRALKLANRLESSKLTAIENQQLTLIKLLSKAGDTAFGHHYGFHEILLSPHVMDTFREKVPIHDYDKMHDEWWYRSLQNEKNVAWKGKTQFFALSSGTTGAASKEIPVTKEMIKSIRRAGLRMFLNLTKYDVPADIYTKDMLMLSGSADLQDKGGYFAGDLSGINVSNTPFWLRRSYKPGLEIAMINDWNARIHEIAKNARKWDVGYIMGIPSWNKLMLEHIIDYHKVSNIHEVWPNLRVFVHGGASFDPYRKDFDAISGQQLIYMDTYLASEGFIAYQNRPDTTSMALLLNNGIFLEFIPFDDAHFDHDGNVIGQPPTLTIGEVELNKDYAVLISTCSGAWRYLIGDVVRFTDLVKNEILITGRTKHFLSICGEHLSVGNMTDAIRNVQQLLNIHIPEFTACGKRAGKYAVHHWHIGCDQPVDAAQVARVLDEQLQLLNDDYRTERSAVMEAPVVTVTPSHEFYHYLESKGKMGGQNKFPRVMKEGAFVEWERFVNG